MGVSHKRVNRNFHFLLASGRYELQNQNIEPFLSQQTTLTEVSLLSSKGLKTPQGLAAMLREVREGETCELMG